MEEKKRGHGWQVGTGGGDLLETGCECAEQVSLLEEAEQVGGPQVRGGMLAVCQGWG
jgi:hypothetical protein